MRFNQHTFAAFTLLEILVVIILITIVAGFSVPNFKKAHNRSREKDAVSNLDMIREAVRLYIARQNGSVPPALANVNAINSTLQLNIIENAGNTYQCLVAGIYSCTATNVDGWQVRFQLDTNDGTVYCSIATCPTL